MVIHGTEGGVGGRDGGMDGGQSRLYPRLQLVVADLGCVAGLTFILNSCNDEKKMNGYITKLPKLRLGLASGDLLKAI